MADHEDGLERRAGGVDAGDHVALAVVGAEYGDVGRRKAGVDKTLGHGVGSRCSAADRVGGVDADKLLEDVARETAGGIVSGGGEEDGDGSQNCEFAVHGVGLWY